MLAAGEVRDLVERMLKPSGRRLDLSSPFVDALLPDGSRLHVVIPDITREHLGAQHPQVRGRRPTDWTTWSRCGTLTAHAARFLEAAVVAGLNIIVAGGTQAGKTTLLNTLVNSIPARERVVTCEEVFELRPNLPDVVAMQTRQPNLEGHGEIRLRRLVKEALRMRPSRIIVGEVRQEESLDLLIALNSGLPGMCTRTRQLRPRGGDQAVHPAAAGRRERHRVVRGAHGGRLRGHRGADRGRAATAGDGCARSSRSLAGSRPGWSRSPTSSPPATADSFGRRASHRIRSDSPDTATTYQHCWPGGQATMTDGS